MNSNRLRLGSLETSEQLIKDLYLDLRTKVNSWASITHQTSQARMGYIGQHLVSVVTGFPGSRSGARGADLILPDSEYGEIKTCYRVDQLGECNNCGARVASIENSCPACNSHDLTRREDSKWLISLRNDDEFGKVLDLKYYFLVLFEFLDIQSEDNKDIVSSIWRIDPKVPGFGYCMIDYYLNIRAHSKSKAPFDFWPYKIKFDIMRPLLIYRSLIKENDSIETQIFPGRDEPRIHVVLELTEYSRSNNLTLDKAIQIANSFNIELEPNLKKIEILQKIEEKRQSERTQNQILSDTIADFLYLQELAPVKNQIPVKFKDIFPKLKEI